MESVAIWQRFSSATFVPSQPHCYISLKPPLLLFHILYISKVSIPFKIKLCTSPMICFDFSRPLGIPYIFSSFVSCSSSSSYGCFFFFFFKKTDEQALLESQCGHMIVEECVDGLSLA